MAALSPNAKSRAVVESATLAITARAAELRADGHDVVSLSAGEPDFPTPEDVAGAGVRAIQEGHTRYTATSGLPELRRAAAGWLQREFGLAYRPDEVMATSGAKAGLHMTLGAIAEPGDAVLLLAPYWVSYPDLVRVAGARPVVLPPVPNQGFVHTGEQIDEAARAHGAKGMILNFPNNPSGAVPTAAQIEELVEAAAANDMWIISDEIYAAMTYDGLEHISPAAVATGRDRTMVIGGPTKSHSFTGWRCAFTAGPADVIAAAGRIQSQVLGNPCTISQHAAIAICEGDHREEVARRRDSFDARRRMLVEGIGAIEGLTLSPPQGAFYALVNAEPVCARLGVNDTELARALLDEEYLAVVPGSAFAIPGFIRLSYAASPDALQEGVARLRRFVEGRG